MIDVSCAVTSTVITFDPTLKAIDDDADPDVTGTPFTVTIAFASVVVGVTEIDVTLVPTAAVYAVTAEANVGVRETDPDNVRSDNVASSLSKVTDAEAAALEPIRLSAVTVTVTVEAAVSPVITHEVAVAGLGVHAGVRV